LYVATYLGLCWGSMLWKDHGPRTTGHVDQSMSSALCYPSGPVMLTALHSVAFVVRLGSAMVAVAARIRSFVFAITMRSVIVIIADSATPPQSIQEQTGRANS